VRVGIVNLLGRVFTGALVDCPFAKASKILAELSNKTDVIVIDFHAEATSEKYAFAHAFNGKASLIVGTHTHVQTNDAQILDEGTGYITDLGMCGAQFSVIGMDVVRAIDRFTHGMPLQYKPAIGDAIISGVVCKVDLASKKAVAINTVSEIVKL
jgi:2',3'-cyclic-nucleotide 2'-phosphodiesterase